MRVISKKTLREFWEQPGRQDSENDLKTWFSVADHAKWCHFVDVKQYYGHRVDQAHGKTIFNICNNKYRLICSIDYSRFGVLVLWVGTHQEYDDLNAQAGKKLKEL